MSKSKIFFILSLCFLLGVFLASFFEIERYIFLILIVAALVIFIINYQNKKIIVASAAILFLALGAWRANISLESARNNLTVQKLGPAEFFGIVAKEPETDEKYQKIIIRSEENQSDKHISIPVSWSESLFRKKEMILVNTDLYPQYSYGDEVKVSCILQEPKNYENSKFDYQMFLAKDGIYRICNKANISILRSNGGNAFYAFILSIKNRFEEKLSAIFPDPEGAYLKGLLLGGSKRMTKDLAEAFQQTGTTHTVAVSGYNVTIVAAFLMEAGIFIGLWRQQVFSFALAGIVLFVLMTGAPSSAVRAGIMGSLVIWAMKEGRLANSTNAILLAAGVMLAINPLLLRYDVGFQLSFLATLGIVQFSPLLEKFFWRRGRAPKLIQETVILTLAATIFVLPIILNSFEKLSLISLLANVVILPAIPYIMGMGMAAGVAGFVFLPLGKLIGFAPYLLLKIELFFVKWLAGWPGASIEVKNFGWKYTLVYYVILFFVVRYFSIEQRRMDNSVGVNEKRPISL